MKEFIHENLILFTVAENQNTIDDDIARIQVIDKLNEKKIEWKEVDYRDYEGEEGEYFLVVIENQRSVNIIKTILKHYDQEEYIAIDGERDASVCRLNSQLGYRLGTLTNVTENVAKESGDYLHSDSNYYVFIIYKEWIP